LAVAIEAQVSINDELIDFAEQAIFNGSAVRARLKSRGYNINE